VAADDGSVYKLNGCTGATDWGDVAVGPGPTSTPAFLPGVKLPDGSTHDIIVVCFGDGSVKAIDGGTGGVLWGELVPVVQTPPAAYGKGSGARIVVASNGSVVELNWAGRQLWSTPMGGMVSGIGLSNVAAGLRPVSPAPTFSPSEVIVTDLAGDVDALNPRTGVIDWGDKQPGPVGAPSIANGVVYVDQGSQPGVDGGVSGLNASTGDPLFHLDLGALNPQPLPPFPAIADGMLFTGSFDAEMRVYALLG